jgi:hypothetical protein
MSRHLDPVNELHFRKNLDNSLGSAADSLESAAGTIQRLRMSGIVHTTPDAGDLLAELQQLSERVLALQVQVRTENHR